MKIKKHVIVIIAIVILVVACLGIWFIFNTPFNPFVQGPVHDKPETDGPPKFLFSIDGGPDHTIDRPMAVLALNGEIYVSDSGKGKVLIFDNNGKFKRFLKPGGEFDMPYGLAADASNIYVADSGSGKIDIFDLKGKYRGVFDVKGVKLVTPAVLQYQSGNLYVSDLGQHQVFGFNIKGGSVLQFGKEGHSAGELYFPHGLAVDSQKTVYVADSGNNRIEAFPRSGAAQIFGSGQNVDIPTPRGLATDWNGNIWAVAGMANQIRVYDPSGNVIFSFSDADTDDGQLSLPNGIYIGQDKRIYVTEVGNKRISVFGY